MPPTRRILYSHLELAEPLGVPTQHARQPQLLELLLQPRRQTGVHAASTREHDGLVERGSDVDVGRLDRVEQELGDAGLLAVDEVGLEEALGRLEPLAADPDHPPVGECVAFNQHGRVLAQALVELEVVRDVAKLLLDLPHSFEVGRSVEGVAAAEEEGDEVPRDVSAGDVQSPGEVVEDDGFVYGDNVGDTVAGVDDNARAETCWLDNRQSAFDQQLRKRKRRTANSRNIRSLEMRKRSLPTYPEHTELTQPE